MNLDKLLRPQGVAVIGASEKSGFGHDTCKNILDYTKDLDKVYFVNPGRDQVFGRPCYKTILDVPARVDLAIVCTPQAAVSDVLKQAAQKGCGAAVIFASGYAETGPDGRRAQDELVKLCEELNLAMMGPNCAGFANYIDDIFSFAFLAEKRERRGSIGLVSQSGQICLAGLDLPNMGFSYLISSGNSAAVKVEEYLEFLADDPDTKVVAAYIEGIAKPDIFIRALEKAAANKKPVVILKSGRSQRGSRLAASHTGSLAGSDSAIDAVFRRYGVIRVDDIQELLGAANLFANLSQLPTADKVAMLNVSGGEAGVSADLGMLYDVEYADLSPETVQGLRDMLPGYSTPSNPLDMTASIAYDPDRLCRGMELFMAEEEVGAVIICYTVTEDIFDATIPCLVAGIEKARNSAWCRKPIIWAPFVEHTRNRETMEKLIEMRVPLLPSGIYSFKLLARLMDFAAFTRKGEKPRVSLPGRNRPEGRKTCSEFESKMILHRSGLGGDDLTVARSADEVRQALERFGPPAAMKINSPDIPHKSDVGGVVLNLVTPREAAAAYEKMMADLTVKCPDAFLDGVLVQKMLKPGLEFIIGVSNDAQFGPMIMVGLGGVFVEIFKDVQLRPAPVSPSEALDMISRLRGHKLLTGYRGGAKMDIPALADLIVKVSDFAAERRDEVLELDLNPVFVYPEGEGVGLVDALLVTVP